MPSRVIRDWTDSDPVNGLSWEAEVFFTRLIMKADDYGRLHGSPKLLRALLFPLKLDSVREVSLERWIAECVRASLVRLYHADGKQFIEINKFGQRLRAEKSKFPEPPPDDGDLLPLDGDPPTNVRRSRTDAGHPLPESEANSEAESEARASRAGARPPSLDQVRAFWAEHGLRGDPERFWNHHQAAGWRIGSGNGRAMRDWHAAARNWSGREGEFGRRAPDRKRDGSLEGLQRFGERLAKAEGEHGPEEFPRGNGPTDGVVSGSS